MQIEKNTRELVQEAADMLTKQGINPTVERVRNITGQGSATTIGDELRNWRKKQLDTQRSNDSPLPHFLIKANRVMLEQAESAAMEQFSEERAGYSNEIDSLRDAIEKSENLHGELMAEIAGLRIEHNEKNSLLLESNNELIRLRSENTGLSESILQARSDLAAKEALLSAKSLEFSEALRAAEERLRGMERNMLLQIDKSRMDAKDALAYAEKKANECGLDVARAQRMVSEQRVAMQEKIDALNIEIGRLQGLLSVKEKRDRKNFSRCRQFSNKINPGWIGR